MLYLHFGDVADKRKPFELNPGFMLLILIEMFKILSKLTFNVGI